MTLDGSEALTPVDVDGEVSPPPLRYHLVVIDSPTQARHVLSYVLNNWRKHAEDGSGTLVDPFSTGVLFAGWKELAQTGLWQIPAGYEPLAVGPPRSWLLTEGWKLRGPISAREVPSGRR